MRRGEDDRWLKEGLYLGLDVGSVSVDAAVADPGGRILWTRYQRSHGQPLATVHRVLNELFREFPRQSFAALGVTGSGAAIVGQLLSGLEVNEIVAAARGVGRLCPQARSIIDMGGEDAKLILVSPGPGGLLKIDDFAMNTMCAAGTGSFLDQQAHRLGLSIEEFSRLALKSSDPPRLAGRCSVFAKTDMIHLQQEATPDYDIVAGLCFAMARNLKSNIAKGKRVVPPVVFIGGVAANQGVARALKEVLELAEDDLLVPEHFACLGALGAALTAADQGLVRPLADLTALERQAGGAARRAERLAPLRLGVEHRGSPPAPRPPPGPLEGYLGVDVGSISTNVVVIDPQMNLLSKQYLLTAGRPLEAVKEGLRRVGEEIGERVTILGAATTGSGRYLTGDFIGADLVRNEITAQATAAAAIDPQVETIFEIGGQDSKYISLNNGAIVDFMMNKVCAAGTGSFLEEQAEKLGISIKKEFGDLALAAGRPVKLGERCTVFMESDLVAHQAAGVTTDDLVAGLSYSIVQNYLNKVVENRPVGRKVFFQGATAHNQGIVAAFEAVLGRPVVVPPHNDVTGGIGAAILAMRERDWAQSRFKGFGLSEIGYQISTFECSGCPNRCAVRRVKVSGRRRPLFYGSRCERYEQERGPGPGAEIPELFQEREERLLSYLRPPQGPPRGRIGLPRTMVFRDYLPLFATFLAELGFEAVLSESSNKKLIHRGVESMVNEPCFPLKVAHGHFLDLLDKGVERIFMPSLVNIDAPGHEMGHGQVCPYSQTLCWTVRSAIDFAAHGVELIDQPIHLGWGHRILRRDLARLASRLGAGRARVGRAMASALAAQREFAEALKARGRQVLAALPPDQRAMVVVSRPYNGFDPGLNLGLPAKMRQLGVWALPMDFLDLDSQMNRPELAEMYWRYGQKILAAAMLIRRDPRLHAVYLSNFGCGPDSFILHFFAQIMAGKPFLEIEVDEHSADVGALTRLEAFLDSLGNAGQEEPQVRRTPRRNLATQKRTVYIPAMSDHAQAVAAAFEACGGAAEVMPESDRRSQELGRRYTSGKECYPCALTAGDMLRLLLDGEVDPAKVAFFMPGGTGPCRFGQYHRYHRLILDQQGFEQVPVYSPDQSEVLYRELRMEGGSEFPRMGWWGVAAVDLLSKALHETRPHERHKGESDRVYQEALQSVCRSIGNMEDLVEALHRARQAFDAVDSNGNSRPRVGVVGEIYTRANRFANDQVVRAIEELGGEAWLPGIGEWLLYTNWCSLRRARRLGRRRQWLDTLIEDFFQRKDEHRLARSWLGALDTLHEPSIRRLLAMAQPYLADTYEGEAVLSLGKGCDMAQRGACGLINIMPFTCMPGNIVNALMKRLREDLGNIPFLALSMDGQQDAGNRIRLEAFMHQVKQQMEREA